MPALHRENDMKRIILAAILGGLIVFVWSAVAHMVTPLGTMGLSVIANEAPVTDAIRANVPKSGMYFFPGMDMSKEPTKEYEAKYKAGPTGLIIVSVGGAEMISPKMLGGELLTNIAGAYIAAILAAMMVGTMMKRAFAIALLAIFASVSLTFSYWIWYGFPAAFVLGEMVTELIGWFLAGLAIAKLVPPANSQPAG
jgi:hypothetical protein